MNAISTRVATGTGRTGHTLPTPKTTREVGPSVQQSATTSSPHNLLQKVAGELTGLQDAVFFTLPGARVGGQIAHGKTNKSLAGAAGLQGVALGGLIGLSVGGPVGMAVGAAVGGLGSLLKADFHWGGEDKDDALQNRVATTLAKHPNPTTSREESAYHGRGLLAGAKAAQTIAFASGYTRGSGKMLGLQRGLANLPSALTRDSSQGLGRVDLKPRSDVKKAIGLPLGIAAAVGGVLAGGLASVWTGIWDTDPLTAGLIASTAVGAVTALSALVFGAPVIAGLGAVLFGTSLIDSASSLLTERRKNGESSELRFENRQVNDLQHLSITDEPKTVQDYANNTQAVVEGFASGMKNGAIEGFSAGSRLSDGLVDGVLTVGQKIGHFVSQLPERVKGLADAVSHS